MNRHEHRPTFVCEHFILPFIFLERVVCRHGVVAERSGPLDNGPSGTRIALDTRIEERFNGAATLSCHKRHGLWPGNR